MCVFCAAIPATLAVGARLNAKQNQTIILRNGVSYAL